MKKNFQHSSSSHLSFFSFLRARDQQRFLLAGAGIGILYFFLLRILYPVPIFYPDSYTYIQAARDHQSVSFRPVQYSEFIRFFKGISRSDLPLILAQYASNMLANLFLFFSVTYFFRFSKWNRLLIFILLVANPLYLFYSNFILSDAFFNSFTVIWFTLLLWMLRKPSWYLTALQLIFLVLLFKLRYHAIIFPAFFLIAVLLSNQAVWKKLLSVFLNVAVIGLLIFNTTNTTEEVTGTRTFSAFGGWQFANNAMYVLCHDRSIDTASVENPATKNVLKYVLNYLDSTRSAYELKPVNGGFMWEKNSPLKSYLYEFAQRNYYSSYFETWNALGPVYGTFGRHVILKRPGQYLQYFVLPNAEQYFFPPFEAYLKYDKQADSLIDSTVQEYYGYKTAAAGKTHPWVFTCFFQPWFTIFPALNGLFLLIGLFYFFSRKYTLQPVLFNKGLLCFSALYLGNFFFVVLLAPSIFRYHVFIITLIVPLLTWLLQQIISPVPQRPVR